MSLILRIVSAFLGGFALHRLYGPSKSLPDRWASMIRESIGIVGVHPFLLLMHHAVKGIDNDDERITIAYYAAAISFGAGVFIGHVFDSVAEEK